MAAPLIWFDATTIRQLRNQTPTGLSRIEAHVLEKALTLPSGRVEFCFFDRYTGSMQRLDRDYLTSLLSGFGKVKGESHGAKKSRNAMAAVSREIERRIRLVTRSAIGKIRDQIPGNSGTVQFNRGDILVLSGANWNMIDARSLEPIIERNGVNVVFLLADMIPWRFPHHFQDQQAVAGFERLALFAGRRASLALSISRHTDRDFAEFCAAAGISPAKTEIIHLGADPPAPDARRPAGMPEDVLSRGFVVSIGTIQVRKNHLLLYNVWRRFAEEGILEVPRLVLAGSPGWLSTDLLTQIRLDPLVRDSIIVLHKVDDSEISWLYAHSKFTLYPSLYEGWGIPIVESLQHGKPCIASNTSSMPEAGQGLTTHIDPLDFAAWYREILLRFENPSILESESTNIKTRFQPRSWQDFSTEFTGRILSLSTAGEKN